MGYEDKKEFKCTSCEKTVMATKFASQKTIQCEECKTNKIPVNQDIVSKILSSKPQTSKQPVAVTHTVEGDKKLVQCTVCNNDMYIGKFASPKTAICENCGGGHTSKKKILSDDIRIDVSKINRLELPNIEDMYITPLIIANPRLREVACPACGHKMNIIRIVDSSSARGLIITYQCDDSKCLFLMTCSEQSNTRLTPKRPHEMFNYRGEVINDLSSAIIDTRTKNSLDLMYKLLVDNNIEIKGDYIPQYLTTGDYKKKNPIGIRNDEVSKLLYWLESDEFEGSTPDLRELLTRLNKVRGIFDTE